MAKKQTSEVFGISNEILSDSYVDRGQLDGQIAAFLGRPNHIAIKGVSKAGKSWLQQRIIPDPLIVRCRLGKTVLEIYQEALGQLGIKLEVSQTKGASFTGSLEAEAEIGVKLLAKVKSKLNLGVGVSSTTTTQNLKQNIDDLGFVAEILIASERRLIVEDFHYLSFEERRKFAFDLKALWDMGFFVVIVGVWSDNNLFLHLNPDLTGRVREISVVWSGSDLEAVLLKGAEALNFSFSKPVVDQLVGDSYGNVGILQRLTLDTLDTAGFTEAAEELVQFDDVGAAQDAALYYAEELNSVYQTFAKRVAGGIRTRKNATGIYAHAMAAVLESSDIELSKGVPIDHIFHVASGREARIQKGNLKLALNNIESLQVDSDGRGLVLSYSDNHVTVVDRQLLLYRRYSTIRWPWEELIEQALASGEDFSGT